MSVDAPSFVHLHVHSEFSLADGLLKVKDLVSGVTAGQAAAMPAIALTDRSNLFGLVKFYEACIAQGIKPIVGAELKVMDPADANAASRPAPDTKPLRRNRPWLIYRVDAGAMARSGHPFYCSANGVWLTDHVPPQFLSAEASDRDVDS